MDFAVLDYSPMLVPAVRTLDQGLEVQTHVESDHEVPVAFTAIEFLG